MECCDDVGPGSHSWGFCSCLSRAEHRPVPQSPVLQDVERSEKKMFRDPVFYKIVQHSLKGRSGGQAVAVWSHLPRPKMSINFELRKSVVHLKKVPWIVTTSFVIDHHVFWCASIMLAAHQDINISWKQCNLKDAVREDGYPGPPFSWYQACIQIVLLSVPSMLIPEIGFGSRKHRAVCTWRSKLNLSCEVFGIIVADVEKLVAA